MRMILASNNQKKLTEMRAICMDLGIELLSLGEAGIVSEVDETGTSYEQNAALKARAACDLSGLPAVADDSGLEVFALGGRPGIRSARYGGEGFDDRDRYLLLLDEMRDVPDGERGGRFVSAICCSFPDGREITARGECAGVILREPAGVGGFGYDPVFYIEAEHMTMAELASERKNQISHRARALAQFRKALTEML